jgi:ATP-dependent helicase/DNAse subunit B
MHSFSSMTTFSFSQVATYLQCPRKYQYHYLDKLKTKAFETTYELLLGSLVHQTLERLYAPAQKEQHPQASLFPPAFPTKSEVLTYFNHHREKETKRLN